MSAPRAILSALAVVWALAPGGASASPVSPAATPDSVASVAPGTSIPSAAPDSIPHTVDSTLVAKLSKGGYVVFFRHCATNWEERDTQENDFANRANQRNLSKEGKIMAAGIGKAIAALKIPVEKVLASPMWRTRDTAQLAFGAYDTTGALFFKGSQYREARIRMLSTRPAPGKNMIYVGHQDQFLPIVPGLKRDQLKEGDALIFEPLGDGKFRVVVQVTPADWARLAGLPAPADAATVVPDAARAIPPARLPTGRGNTATGAAAQPDSASKH